MESKLTGSTTRTEFSEFAEIFGGLVAEMNALGKDFVAELRTHVRIQRVMGVFNQRKLIAWSSLGERDVLFCASPSLRVLWQLARRGHRLHRALVEHGHLTVLQYVHTLQPLTQQILATCAYTAMIHRRLPELKWCVQQHGYRRLSVTKLVINAVRADFVEGLEYVMLYPYFWRSRLQVSALGQCRSAEAARVLLQSGNIDRWDAFKAMLLLDKRSDDWSGIHDVIHEYYPTLIQFIPRSVRQDLDFILQSRRS